MPSVLVTGAARGIGRATAARLAAAGWEVYAGVRQASDGEGLEAEHPGRIHAVTLDVTDAAQVAALEAALPPTLDGLVNNAGIALGGPVEGVPLEELRRQLEVNVVGQAAVTQAALPRLRASRGRIVFVSSVSGLVATPLMGPYVASKFALEGLADALRMELAPWGVRVSLIEPTQTDTDLWRRAEEQLEATVRTLRPGQAELYARYIDGYRKAIPRARAMAVPVDHAAAAIERALTARRPRARYVVGKAARTQLVLARLTPTPVLDAFLRVSTGVPWRLR